MNENIVKELVNLEKKAFKSNEIPVGAVIIFNNRIIARAYNKREKSNIISNHAEIIAIHKAAKKLKTWKLNDCILYTSLFPCPMCASAIQQSRIKKVYFNNDTLNKTQKKISKEIFNNKQLNHQVECEQFNYKSDYLISFFQKIRN